MDGIIVPSVARSSAEVMVFHPERSATITGVRMIDPSAGAGAANTGRGGFFKAPRKPRTKPARKSAKKSAKGAWVTAGEQRGLF